jgi:hypothetical protein
MIVNQHYCTHRKGLIMTPSVFCKKCVKAGYAAEEKAEECTAHNLHEDSRQAWK